MIRNRTFLGRLTFAQAFATLLNANGANLKTIPTLTRHADVSVTIDKYVQAVTRRNPRPSAGLWAY